MTTVQVVETSVTVNNNSPIQDYFHSDGQTRPTFEMTPGYKPFTKHALLHRRKLWSKLWSQSYEASYEVKVLLNIDKRASCLGTDNSLYCSPHLKEGFLKPARQRWMLCERWTENLPCLPKESGTTCIASFFSAFPLWRYHYQQSIPRTPEGVLPNSQRRRWSVTTKSTYL